MVQQSEDRMLMEYASGDGSQRGEASTIARPRRDMRQRRKEKMVQQSEEDVFIEYPRRSW